MKFKNTTGNHLHIYEYRFVNPNAEFEISQQEYETYPMIKDLIARKMIKQIHKQAEEIKNSKSVEVNVNIGPQVENNNITTAEAAITTVIGDFVEEEILHHKNYSEELVKTSEETQNLTKKGGETQSKPKPTPKAKSSIDDSSITN